jgi:hypothetical protein
MTTNQMTKARVALTAFTSLKIFLFIAFMRNVVVKMTGNAAFLNPIPALVALLAALDDLAEKATNAINGGKENRALRDVAWATALDFSRRLATYVQLTAAGDIVVLLSSGFEATKGRGPVQAILMPLDLRVIQGVMGELVARWKRAGRNSLMFEVQHGTEPAGPYTDHPSVTATQAKVGALVPGTLYWIRVRANGAGGSSDWTAPVCKMVI